jgi:hypothetical protein
MGIHNIRIIAHQAPGRRIIAKLVDCGKSSCCNQRGQLVAMHVEDRIAADQQRVGFVPRERCEGAFDSLLVARFQYPKLRSSACAAACMSDNCPRPSGVLGLIRAARAVALGTSSRRSPSRFGARLAEMIVIPVALPPGRERLEARPNPTGSPQSRTRSESWRSPFSRQVRNSIHPPPQARPQADEPDQPPFPAGGPAALRRSDIRW